jgi:hypothetical protein
MAGERITVAATLVRKSPPWLRRAIGGPFMRALGGVFDNLLDRTTQSVLARFPGSYADVLPHLGRDRKIRRGPGESDDTYASRLRRWIIDHKTRGGPYALLAQLYAFFAVDPTTTALVYTSGSRYQMDLDGVITRDVIGWTGGGDPEKWAQAWLFFDADGCPCVNDLEVAQYLQIPRDWNAGHMLPIEVVILWEGASLIGYPPSLIGVPTDGLIPSVSPTILSDLDTYDCGCPSFRTTPAGDFRITPEGFGRGVAGTEA